LNYNDNKGAKYFPPKTDVGIVPLIDKVLLKYDEKIISDEEIYTHSIKLLSRG